MARTPTNAGRTEGRKEAVVGRPNGTGRDKNVRSPGTEERPGTAERTGTENEEGAGTGTEEGTGTGTGTGFFQEPKGPGTEERTGTEERRRPGRPRGTASRNRSQKEKISASLEGI